MTGLAGPEFSELFDAARHSVFRLEGHQDYAIPADDDELVAFRTGAPRPERSVRTSPWVRRIAVTTAAGRDWSRVRVVQYPLTEYTRFELVAYVESQAVGERILLTESAAPCEDFWLFDAGTDDAVAVWMRYGSDGALVARDLETDAGVIRHLAEVAEQMAGTAVPLNVWLAVARG